MQESRLSMFRGNKMLWAISTVTAAALTVSGMHAKNVAELTRGEAGLYRQMPGIILGLLSGFFLDSPIVVAVITIAANATLYYFLLDLRCAYGERRDKRRHRPWRQGLKACEMRNRISGVPA